MALFAVSKVRASSLNLAYMAVFLPLPCSYSHILDIAVLSEMKELLVNISIAGKPGEEEWVYGVLQCWEKRFTSTPSIAVTVCNAADPRVPRTDGTPARLDS